MTTLADKAILSGADNRPPMLEKDMYDSWKSIMELYIMNRQHGRIILESVENGPLIWPTIEENGVTRPKKYSELSATETIQAHCDVKATNIILQGLPPEVYALVSNHRIAKELWERIQLLILATMRTINDGRVTLQPVQGWRRTSFVAVLQGYSTGCECEDKVLLVQAQTNGQILHEEELAFFVDLEIAEGQATQTVITHNGAYQADDLDDMTLIVMNSTLSKLPSWQIYLIMAMPSSEQSNVVNHSETEITSDSIIPYSQYVIESQQATVQNSNSSAQQDALNESVKVLKEGQNVDLMSNDNVSDLSAQSVEIDRLKQTLYEHLKEKESLMQTVTLLKNDFKKEESGNIDREIALEKRIKQLDNIVFKRDQSAQNVHMLTKPQFFYDHTTKKALGFQNPFYLKKAQQLEPKLYDGNVIKNTSTIVIPDSKETLILAEESHFETQFVPQTELSTEQAFWSQNSMNSLDPTLSSRPTKVEHSKLMRIPNPLLKYYEKVGISHETFVARYPQQNGVAERRNRTLIKAACTMLIYAKALLFLWAEAVVTAYFDKLTAMASEHSSLGPALHEMTPVTISSGLVSNPPPSTPFVPPSRTDWDIFCSRTAVSTDSPSSTTVDQDAPSTSNSQTTPETQSPIIPNDIEEDNNDLDIAHMNNDLFFGIPIPKNNSEASSSSDVIPTVVHTAAPNSEHVTKWTKDHPLDNIIGELERPIEAMQKELNEFERLKVWELVPRPDKEKGIDFEESCAPVARLDAI
ncbi:retrovirus-related pol polyprotein from transposon TNT 1-94 [Tanacetum coccineum]